MQFQALLSDCWPADDRIWNTPEAMWGQDVEKVKPYVKDGGYELDMRLQPIDNYISSHVITVEVSTVEGAPRALRKFCHGSKAEFQKVMQGKVLCPTQAAV